MKRTTKALLIASVICLVAGLVFVSGLVNVPNEAAGVYVLLPTGAIMFGLFLITKALEKETTRYDEEQRANLARAETARAREIPPEPNHPVAHHHEQSFVRSH